jgi:hypothetical protein
MRHGRKRRSLEKHSLLLDKREGAISLTTILFKAQGFLSPLKLQLST